MPAVGLQLTACPDSEASSDLCAPGQVGLLCPALPQAGGHPEALLLSKGWTPRPATQQCATAGMALHLFHSTSSSLPDLPNDGWKKLLAPLPAGEAQAAVLLSTPDNGQVCMHDLAVLCQSLFTTRCSALPCS